MLAIRDPLGGEETQSGTRHNDSLVLSAGKRTHVAGIDKGREPWISDEGGVEIRSIKGLREK